MEEQTPQETSGHYLKRENLQDLLERLFPGQTEFTIRVTQVYLKVVHRAQG